MITSKDLKFIGSNLKRPECVLVTSDGAVHVADWRGGVTVILRNGRSKTILAKGNFKIKPNGIAILAEQDGWLLTHLGDERGGVYRLTREGILYPYLVEINGEPLPPTNYVHIDDFGRVWITVSTRIRPRILACRPDHSDGFIILVDQHGSRIVADNLGFTNECVVNQITNKLYVNETFGRRLISFDIGKDGKLTNKAVISEFGFGDYPDGLTFDIENHIWVTSIVSNRIYRVAPDGSKELIFEDSDKDHLKFIEELYLNAKLERKHLDVAVSKALKNISSLAFGGFDLKTIYLGCLQGTSIAVLRSKVAGLVPAHWSPRKWKELKSQ